ncbi:S-layer homology domain-containing protein [Paenibacillus segetis]|nr:S-layer homology domain-containing protein [Paenibacillus segetis]
MINGISDNKFSPGRNITRSEFVKILAGIAGADVSLFTGNPFADVSS